MPELVMDIDAIGRNTQVVARTLREHGLDLVAVTKGCLGEPRVAAAMLEGGAVGLADSRDDNLRRLRRHFPGVELHRIGLPSLRGASEPGDLSYVTSWEGAEAVRRSGGGKRKVVIQVESGDGREGIPPEEVAALAGKIANDDGLLFEGVSTNYACLQSSPEGLRQSIDTIVRTAQDLQCSGLPVSRVSAGSSSVLWLVAQDESLPAAVTELRCGEALLLGHEALEYEPLAGCEADACLIRAEVVEEYTRRFSRGASRRLLLAVGQQDLGAGRVRLLEPGLREVGRSSDYLVVEVEPDKGRIPLGTMIDMLPSYEALVAAGTSPHVQSVYRDS